MSVELIGAQSTIERFRGIAHRAENPALLVRQDERQFERMEQALFASYGGKYVDTGRTLRSLTGPGPDSLREVVGAEFLFGSLVPYAQYLRDEHGGSAVLVSPRHVIASGEGNRILRRLVGDVL